MFTCRCRAFIGIVLAVLLSRGDCKNAAARLASAHFEQYGVRLPTREFTKAMGAAAIDITHLSCRKSLVILGMANEEALNRTVPLFLQSMSRIQMSGKQNAGRTMDAGLVLVAWSQEALQMCRSLQRNYSHQCVRDAEHRAATGSFGFHSSGFNALGFAKIKYILNGLSCGHDVVFLDTDVLLLADPLPYLLTRGSDLAAALEKCAIVDDRLAFHEAGFMAAGRKVPALNIGVLYFKATAGVTRCVYNWVWDMYGQVEFRPNVWDQDIYGLIMHRCTGMHRLRWQPLDPRVVQSACFQKCGCAFPDSAITPERLGSIPEQEGAPFLPGGEHACGPQHWGGWLLRHFACSGDTASKGRYMGNMLEGVEANASAQITRRWETKALGLGM